MLGFLYLPHWCSWSGWFSRSVSELHHHMTQWAATSRSFLLPLGRSRSLGCCLLRGSSQAPPQTLWKKVRASFVGWLLYSCYLSSKLQMIDLLKEPLFNLRRFDAHNLINVSSIIIATIFLPFYKSILMLKSKELDTPLKHTHTQY